MEHFKRGDEVALTINVVEVAQGLLQRINPDDLMYNAILGEGRIGVLLIKVLEPSRELPFSSPRATYLHGALDSTVIINHFIKSRIFKFF